MCPNCANIMSIRSVFIHIKSLFYSFIYIYYMSLFNFLTPQSLLLYITLLYFLNYALNNRMELKVRLLLKQTGHI